MGIAVTTWLVLRWGLGRLPRDMTSRHVASIGLLGGMGFTMSIFIANLSFGSNTTGLGIAKTAILLASLIAGVAAYVWLRWIAAPPSET